MTASSGQDRFHFESISDSAAGIDRDRITGFDAATDQFVFGFAAPIYIGAEDFNGDGHSEARLVNMGELDILQIDVGGDGGVDMELQLVGLNGPLTDDNFLGQF
jgi:hypothetical protein